MREEEDGPLIDIEDEGERRLDCGEMKREHRT